MAPKSLPVKPAAVYRVAKEVRLGVEAAGAIAVAGAAGPAQAVREALVRAGDASAVRDLTGRRVGAADLEGAEVLVYAVEGRPPGGEDERVFRLADRRDVGVVCLLVGGGPLQVPFVLATDVVRAPAGEPLPVERVLERVAARAGDRGYALAARLPALRRPVAERIVRRFARQNGILGAAVFVPGADLPVLTLNQVRMVLRVAATYGEEIDRERAPELLAVVGAGLGFRALARELLAFAPGPGWAVKGGVAFAATKTLGEAAIAYFEAGVPDRLAGAVRSRS